MILLPQNPVSSTCRGTHSVSDLQGARLNKRQASVDCAGYIAPLLSRCAAPFLFRKSWRVIFAKRTRPVSRYGNVMTNVATLVLTTVNAPYGVGLCAHQLAAMISDPASVHDFNASVFAFFSEVSVALQEQFISSMGVDSAQVSAVASQFAHLSGYTFPLAA